jgi:hypothetical protein
MPAAAGYQSADCAITPTTSSRRKRDSIGINITSEAGWKSLIDKTLAAYGQLDILVNIPGSPAARSAIPTVSMVGTGSSRSTRRASFSASGSPPRRWRGPAAGRSSISARSWGDGRLRPPHHEGVDPPRPEGHVQRGVSKGAAAGLRVEPAPCPEWKKGYGPFQGRQTLCLTQRTEREACHGAQRCIAAGLYPNQGDRYGCGAQPLRRSCRAA